MCSPAALHFNPSISSIDPAGGPTTSAERWVRALAFPGLLVVSLLWGPQLQRLPSFCLWKRLTGLECYGCGMGRALVSACRGDFATAFHFHHLVFVALACLVATSASAIVELRSTGGTHV